MPMSPQELTLLITAVANSLYGCMSAMELSALASVFNQLGDTLVTLAAQKALQDARCAGVQSGADSE